MYYFTLYYGILFFCCNIFDRDISALYCKSVSVGNFGGWEEMEWLLALNFSDRNKVLVLAECDQMIPMMKF